MSNSRPLAACSVMIETRSAAFAALDVHHQRDMFEKRRERREIAHRAHEFLQVLQPSRGVGGALGLPHVDQAALLEDRLGEFFVRRDVDLRRPALEAAQQVAQDLARPRLELLAFDEHARRAHQRNAGAPAIGVQHVQRRFAQAAPGQIVDALEGEIVVRLGDAAQIGQRVADFGPLVESRSADHLIGDAERDEALLELAHLERGAHENGDLARAKRRRAAPPRSPRRRRAPPPGCPTGR